MTYRSKLEEIQDLLEDDEKRKDGAQRVVLVESLESRQMLSVTASTVVKPNLTVTPAAQGASFTGYTPAQIRKAYGFDQIKGDGTGQTIAIVDAYDDPNIASDLAAFDAKYGLKAANLVKINQNGGSTKSVAADANWAGEIALDVEWAHAIAPGAKIVLVEANSSSLGDLMTAVNTARNYAGVSVVSMSWGAGEFYQQSAYDKYFTTPSGHQGVTFVASAGDNGSWYGPEWPSSSANVLAVGGTSLVLNSDGTYAGEAAWSGGGGGVSQVTREPSYQSAVQRTGARSAPDVSYDANPNTGFAVYDSYGSGGWTVVGGTSAGAPQWAALVALADQARASAGKGTLDGATGTLPTLYSLYNSKYSANFNDVTAGATSWFVQAGGGYDAATGLGTPKAPTVVASLAGIGGTTTTAAKTTTSTTTAAKVTKSTGRHFWFYPSATEATPATAPAANLSPATLTATTYVLHADASAGPDAPAVFDALVGAPDLREGRTSSLLSSTATAAPTVTGATVSTASAMPASSVATPSMPSAAMAASTRAVPLTGFVNVAAATAASTSWTFARADATAMISDAVAAFTRDVVTAVESSGLGDVTTTMWSDKRWMTTVGVLAADAVMVGYYVRSRKTAGRKRVVQVMDEEDVDAGAAEEGDSVEFSLVPLVAPR